MQHAKYIKCTALYHTIMHEFLNECGTSSVPRLQLSGRAAPCYVPKTQPEGVDERQSTEHTRTTAVPESSSTIGNAHTTLHLHATTGDTKIDLGRFFILNSNRR